MPKISGGLANVSTDYPTLDDGVYPLRIDKVEFKPTGKGGTQVVTDMTATNVETGQDFKIRDYNTVEVNKNGVKEDNPVGLANLKRMVEQTLGEERANDPDFDTDELIGWTGQAQIKRDSYTKDGADKPTFTNKVVRFLA